MPLPTIILPGYLAGALPYGEMTQALQTLGYPTVTVPLRRRDWLPTLGGRSVLPILRQLDQTVKHLIQQTGSEKVNLVGHSAGGWICRIYLGEVPYNIHPNDTEPYLWKAHPQVQTLITLGTPHVSQERWTKRNLDFVKTHYPGAFHPTVHYVCVAGKSAYGTRLSNWFTYSSYEMTGGQGNCWGDGITPIAAAHLDGAENLTLENIWHSPRPGRSWYGSPEAVQMWSKYLR